MEYCGRENVRLYAWVCAVSTLVDTRSRPLDMIVCVCVCKWVFVFSTPRALCVWRARQTQIKEHVSLCPLCVCARACLLVEKLFISCLIPPPHTCVKILDLIEIVVHRITTLAAERERKG